MFVLSKITMSIPAHHDAAPSKTDNPIPASFHTIPSPNPTPSDVEKAPLPEASNDAPKASSAGLSTFKALGILDRFLAVWIFLAMLIGILLGNFVPSVGPALKQGTFVGVSIPIAVGLLVMMYPILCKVQYEKLHEVFRSRGVWIQLGFSLVVNWIVAPFVMVCFPP